MKKGERRDPFKNINLKGKRVKKDLNNSYDNSENHKYQHLREKFS
jgi:hypothetical protein